MIHFLLGILLIFRGKLLVLGRVQGGPRADPFKYGAHNFIYTEKNLTPGKPIDFRGDITLFITMVGMGDRGPAGSGTQSYLPNVRTGVSLDPQIPEANGRQGGPNTDPHKAFGH